VNSLRCVYEAAVAYKQIGRLGLFQSQWPRIQFLLPVFYPDKGGPANVNDIRSTFDELHRL
jgi:hypothetical protein